MLPQCPPRHIQVPAARIRLEAFDSSLNESLWRYIQSDRMNPKRKHSWSSITDFQSLRDYVGNCDIENPESEEFAYVLKDSANEILGTIHIHTINWAQKKAEIGYGVHHRFEGQGFVSEALSMIERTLKKMGFHSLEISSPVWNSRSRAVAKRSSYTFIQTVHLGKDCDGCDDCLEIYRKTDF